MTSGMKGSFHSGSDPIVVKENEALAHWEWASPVRRFELFLRCEANQSLGLST
jgi:hypothetical protein